MKNAIHTNIKFDDLTFEKQEAILKILVEKLQALAEIEGKEFLARDWHEPKPKTWQEAYCRVYALEHELWRDYEDKTGPEVPPFMWETWQEAHTRHLAQVMAVKAFTLTEIEVSL